MEAGDEAWGYACMREVNNEGMTIVESFENNMLESVLFLIYFLLFFCTFWENCFFILNTRGLQMIEVKAALKRRHAGRVGCY